METKLVLKNRIREFRKLKNLTQQELADEIGVNRMTISLIEKGEVAPTIRLVLFIGSVLEKTADELFYFEYDDSI